MAASRTYAALVQQAAFGLKFAEEKLHIAESYVTPPPARSRAYPQTRPERRPRLHGAGPTELFPPDCRHALEAVGEAGEHYGRGEAAIHLLTALAAYSTDDELRARAAKVVKSLAPRYADLSRKLFPRVTARVGRICLSPERLTELGGLAESYARLAR